MSAPSITSRHSQRNLETILTSVLEKLHHSGNAKQACKPAPNTQNMRCPSYPWSRHNKVCKAYQQEEHPPGSGRREKASSTTCSHTQVQMSRCMRAHLIFLIPKVAHAGRLVNPWVPHNCVREAFFLNHHCAPSSLIHYLLTYPAPTWYITLIVVASLSQTCRQSLSLKHRL